MSIINNLIKIMYFDEQAALDSLEISEGGSVVDTINNKLEKGKGAGADVNVGKNFLGVFGLKLNGNAKRFETSIAHSQITSTLISKFVGDVSEKKLKLVEASDLNLKIQKNSNAYYRNLLPMTHMIKDVSAFTSNNDSDLNFLDFEKIGDSLDALSAYYSLEGEYEGEKAIFRFNIDGLRNNYTLYDLVKVSKLKVYGVLIGESDSIDLTFDKVMNDLVVSDNDDDHDFDDLSDEYINDKSTVNEENNYKIIDVILAGVEK